MKKITLILIALFMALVCSVLAEEKTAIYTSGLYKYILLDDGTVEIKDYIGKSSQVDIPKTIDGHLVTSIGNQAFGMCQSLTEISIPESVKTIGNEAFIGCSSIKNIIIPDSVITIGDEAFDSCDSIEYIIIPDSVTTIGDEAFDDCYNLTTVLISNSVRSIGINPFTDCHKLKTIKVEPDHPTLATIDGVLFDMLNGIVIILVLFVHILMHWIG